jgi:hypothetical protein
MQLLVIFLLSSVGISARQLFSSLLCIELDAFI